MSDTFLTQEEVSELTGRKVRAKQIEALRKMGIPFWVNAVGRAVIARRAIEGGGDRERAKSQKVVPNVYRMMDNGIAREE